MTCIWDTAAAAAPPAALSMLSYCPAPAAAAVSGDASMPASSLANLALLIVVSKLTEVLGPDSEVKKL